MFNSMSTGVSFTLEQGGKKKWMGHAPKSEKRRGHCPPGLPVPPPMRHYSQKNYNIGKYLCLECEDRLWLLKIAFVFFYTFSTL